MDTQTGSQVFPVPSFAKIAEALSKAQGEIVQPEKNKTVEVKDREGLRVLYTFDYADYNAIVQAVKGPLSKYGICFTHLIVFNSNDLVLLTRLIHSSGEFIESFYPLPRTTDPKSIGGAITYGKRYCLSAITGCVADDDLDAEPSNVSDFKDRKPAPTPNPGASPVKPKTQAPKAEEPPVDNSPSASQVARLFAISSSRGWEKEQVRGFMIFAFNLASTKDLTKEQYNDLVHTIETKSFPEAVPAGDWERIHAAMKVSQGAPHAG